MNLKVTTLKCNILFSLINTIITNALDTDNNNSDIYYSYSGHNEAKNNAPVIEYKSATDYIEVTTIETETVVSVNTKPEDIVFIPNDKPVIRNEDDYLENNPVDLTDVMTNRRLGDMVREHTTETANEDILFISGKNNENVEQVKKDKQTIHTDTYVKIKDKGEKRKRLDCSKLDCANTIASVCGEKMEEGKLRYRLFMNECFFRKVNCAFKYPINRYKLVEIDKCSHFGNHSNRRPNFLPNALPLTSNLEETRRSFSSRRSLNADINGQACSHACPVTCPDKYEPQCAMSSSGQRHMFLNHCKLDYNSCLNKVVWYVRPLAECVGGKKADVQQNRGFIAWMQKVGIVDGRGRLTIAKGIRPKRH